MRGTERGTGAVDAGETLLQVWLGMHQGNRKKSAGAGDTGGAGRLQGTEILATKG